MSANSKWEAVTGHMDAGDRVRMTHPNGSVLFGTFEGDKDIHTPGNHANAYWWSVQGFLVERAVSERTLPSEPGFYVSASDYAATEWAPEDEPYFLTAWADGKNDFHCYGGPEDDLVRLVPVTEVDELRDRLNNIRSAVELGTLALAGTGNRDYLLRLLDGQVSL